METKKLILSKNMIEIDINQESIHVNESNVNELIGQNMTLTERELYLIRWALQDAIEMDEAKAYHMGRPTLPSTDENKRLLIKFNNLLNIK